MTPAVVVIGGGPAGLATAIGFARANVRTLLVERRTFPIDKPCGEGLLPNGVAALERIGLDRAAVARAGQPISGIRYESARGRVADLAFEAESGLGLRRTCLSSLLAGYARSLPALDIRTGVTAAVRVDSKPRPTPIVTIGDDEIAPRLVVAADGLHSGVRRMAERPPRDMSPRRWGVRQHYEGPPWTDRVEVSFADGVEAYVTPLVDGVNVAWLWDRDRAAVGAGPDLVPSLTARLPRLAARLSGRRAIGPALAAGPFFQRPPRETGDGLVCVGDAGGYVDPLTGEGVGLALRQAEIVVRELTPHLTAADRDDVVPAHLVAACRRAIDGACRSNRQLTRLLLFLARRPALVERAVAALARDPALFRHCVDANLGRRDVWRVPPASLVRLAVRRAGPSGPAGRT